MVEISEITGDLAQARTRIIDRLDQHAAGHDYSFDAQYLLFEATEAGDWSGGILCRISLDWMFIELLAVAETAAGQGLGRALMDRAENAARHRNLTGIWLDTFSFQAPDFYPKLGYAEIGRIDDYPPGGARIFFQKRLDGAV